MIVIVPVDLWIIVESLAAQPYLGCLYVLIPAYRFGLHKRLSNFVEKRCFFVDAHRIEKDNRSIEKRGVFYRPDRDAHIWVWTKKKRQMQWFFFLGSRKFSRNYTRLSPLRLCFPQLYPSFPQIGGGNVNKKSP